MKDDWTTDEMEQALTGEHAAHEEKSPMRFWDVFVGWLTGLLMGAVIFILAQGVLGCKQYDGMRVVEGTHFELGVNIPYAEAAQMSLLGYSSGLVVGVTSNAQTVIEYQHCETNDWIFGMVLTRIYRTLKMEVEPCEVTPTNAPCACMFGD